MLRFCLNKHTHTHIRFVQYATSYKIQVFDVDRYSMQNNISKQNVQTCNSTVPWTGHQTEISCSYSTSTDRHFEPQMKSWICTGVTSLTVSAAVEHFKLGRTVHIRYFTNICFSSRGLFFTSFPNR